MKRGGDARNTSEAVRVVRGAVVGELTEVLVAGNVHDDVVDLFHQAKRVWVEHGTAVDGLELEHERPPFARLGARERRGTGHVAVHERDGGLAGVRFGRRLILQDDPLLAGGSECAFSMGQRVSEGSSDRDEE